MRSRGILIRRRFVGLGGAGQIVHCDATKTVAYARFLLLNPLPLSRRTGSSFLLVQILGFPKTIEFISNFYGFRFSERASLTLLRRNWSEQHQIKPLPGSRLSLK